MHRWERHSSTPGRKVTPDRKIVIAAVVDRRHAPDWLRVGLVMGFVGGYTTFSTFAQESLDLIRVGHSGVAALYAVTSVAVGIIAASLGAAIGRLL